MLLCPPPPPFEIPRPGGMQLCFRTWEALPSGSWWKGLEEYVETE